MKKQSIIFFLTFLFIGQAFSQSKTPIFLGVQPNITVEPFYEEGELDIDIFPFVFEASISLRTDIKVTPIVNYHIGGEKNGVSDVAIFTVLPVFFKVKEVREDRPFGFYIGPVIGFGRNLLNEHYTTTLALEPGYMFETKNRFTISLGIQLGGSYFSYDSDSVEENKWVTHWGPKISFGFWIN